MAVGVLRPLRKTEEQIINNLALTNPLFLEKEKEPRRILRGCRKRGLKCSNSLWKAREAIISRREWPVVLDTSERHTTSSGSYCATNNF